MTDVDVALGDLRTLGDYTDFAALDFTLTNAAGGKLRIVVDRCGGDGCSAAVAAADGAPLLEREMIDASRAAAAGRGVRCAGASSRRAPGLDRLPRDAGGRVP